MLRLIFCVLPLLGILSLSSCKKDSNDGDSTSKRIKSKVTLGSNEREDFVYDSQGRLIEEQNSSGYKTTYSYGPGSMVWSFYESGVFQYSLNWKLNDKGYIERCSLPNGQIITVSYDSNGHPASYTTQHANGFSTTTTYTYSAGNLIQLVRTNSSNSSTSINTNDYRASDANTLSNLYFGKSFMGKDSKNLLLSEDVPGFNGSRTIIFYDYDLDSEGYVLKQYETAHYQNNPNPSSKQIVYTYQ